MVTIKTPAEIKLIKEGGKRLSRILGEIVKFAKVGITTEEVDNLARKLIKQAGGEPAFLGYKVPGSPFFPSALCISINQEVVHAPAVPARELKKGDVVGLDIGMKYPLKMSNVNGQMSSVGYYTDMAVTIGIGRVSQEADKLMKVTREALVRGLKVIKPGNLITDIGREIEKYVYQFKIEPEAPGSTGLTTGVAPAAALRAWSKYGIVRDLVGHGVGYAIHEEPPIPNYFDPHLPRLKLKEGMALAIEPMITLGSDEVKVLPDKWTVVTRDGSIAAHFEVTAVVTKRGYDIATPLP